MAGQADPGRCSLNMLVIATLWLASAGRVRGLSGPTCRDMGGREIEIRHFGDRPDLVNLGTTATCERN